MTGWPQGTIACTCLGVLLVSTLQQHARCPKPQVASPRSLLHHYDAVSLGRHSFEAPTAFYDANPHVECESLSVPMLMQCS